jgi:hypothetical protein
VRVVVTPAGTLKEKNMVENDVKAKANDASKRASERGIRAARE